jgi:FdhD protein
LQDRNAVETFVSKFVGEEARTVADVLAVEEPLEIQLAYGRSDAERVQSISVTNLPTNSSLDPVEAREQIQSALPDQPRKNIVRVELAADVKVSLANLERNFLYDFQLRDLWGSVAAGLADFLPAAHQK